MRALSIAFCKIQGLRVWRQNCGKIVFIDKKTKKIRTFSAGPPKGAADLSGIYHGYRVEIEVKAPGKKRTQEQEHWAKFVQEHGGIYLLVTYDTSKSLKENVCDSTETMRYVLHHHRYAP